VSRAALYKSLLQIYKYLNTSKSIGFCGGVKMTKDRIVTSVRIDAALWKEAKIEAIRRGTTLASLLDKAIRNELRRNKELDDKKSHIDKL